jgi:hypothetical protein
LGSSPEVSGEEYAVYSAVIEELMVDRYNPGFANVSDKTYLHLAARGNSSYEELAIL